MAFLLNFSVLLLATICCAWFYHKTCESYLKAIETKETELTRALSLKKMLANKVDSLNVFLEMLNTNQVQNEFALERSIIALKNSAGKIVTELEETGDSKLEKAIIYNIEAALQDKKNFQVAKSEEDIQRKKLSECMEANKSVKSNLNK